MPWMSINQWKKKHKIGKKLKFKLLGFDTFSNEWYGLGEFKTEEEAREAGIKRLKELAISQPASSSGGQGIFGIQDRVFIETPDGQRHRLLG